MVDNIADFIGFKTKKKKLSGDYIKYVQCNYF